MFSRPEANYEVPDEVIDGILQDEAQPLRRIFDLLPENATILDIGAGSGILARVLARRGKCFVIDGIEPSTHAARLAAPYYRRMFTGLAQEFFVEIASVHYDFVILADVIEHIPDPLAFLGALLPHLKPDTRLIISTPNVAFGAIRLALLNGHFDYVDSGLLERTHLRFFTLGTLKALLSQLDLHIEQIQFLRRNIFQVEIPAAHLHCDAYTLMRLARDETALAYQYLVIVSSKPSNIQTLSVSFGSTPASVILYYFSEIFRVHRLVRYLYRLFRK